MVSIHFQRIHILEHLKRFVLSVIIVLMESGLHVYLVLMVELKD